MSLEASVSALLVQTNNLLAIPQAIADAAAAAVTRVSNAYTALVAGQVSVVVDPVNGQDDPARSGLAAQPLKTVQAALARTPVGGVCIVALTGPITIDTIILVKARILQIVSTTATRHAVNFVRSTLDASGQTYRNLTGFRLSHTAQLNFIGVTINMPAADGAFLPALEYQESAPFRVSGAGEDTLTSVQLTLCDLNLPAVPFARLTSHFSQPLALVVNGCTLTGSPLVGRISRANTNTATPVATSTLRWMLTNLTEI